MGKLIDSDWLRAQWDEPTDWMDGDQILHHYTWYKTMIDVAPTVDAVPVVRCKDCKHYQFADNRAFGFPVKRCEWSGFEDVDDKDFCSRGERKDGEHG